MKYSRILIPIPPIQSVKDKMIELVESIFSNPEYIKTPWFEGYAFSWRTWYGFNDRTTSNFPYQIKDCIGEYEMQAIDWVDEDRWEWIDMEKSFGEIFEKTYKDGEAEISISPCSISIKTPICESFLFYKNYESLKSREELKKTFRTLARRGYWNTCGFFEGEKNRFYRDIGFDFEQPFKK